MMVASVILALSLLTWRLSKRFLGHFRLIDVCDGGQEKAVRRGTQLTSSNCPPWSSGKGSQSVNAVRMRRAKQMDGEILEVDQVRGNVVDLTFKLAGGSRCSAWVKVQSPAEQMQVQNTRTHHSPLTTHHHETEYESVEDERRHEEKPFDPARCCLPSHITHRTVPSPQTPPSVSPLPFPVVPPPSTATLRTPLPRDRMLTVQLFLLANTTCRRREYRLAFYGASNTPMPPALSASLAVDLRAASATTTAPHARGRCSAPKEALGRRQRVCAGLHEAGSSCSQILRAPVLGQYSVRTVGGISPLSTSKDVW